MQTIFISGPKINKTISIFRCCLKLEVELLLIGVGKILDMAGKIKDKGGIDDLVEVTCVVEAAGEVDVTSIQDLLVASKLLEEHSYNSSTIPPDQSSYPYPSLSVSTCPLPPNTPLQNPLQVHDYCVAAGENELAGTSNCSVEEAILWYTYWFTV